MTKEKKTKIKKWSLRIGLGTLAFAGGLAATFFLVPGRVNTIHFDTPAQEVPEETYFSRFVTRVLNTADVDNGEKMEGLVGQIKELTVEWPDNKVVVDGSLDFAMRNLNDFDVTVDLNVDYNGKAVDLGIGYTGRTFYLAFQDLFIKSSYNGTQDLLENLNYLFFNPDVPESEGLGISVDLDGVIDSLIGGFDINSLLSGGGDSGLSISFGEEVVVENKVEAPLSISLGEGKDPIELSLFVYKDTCDLAGASLKNVKIGDVSIKGDIVLDVFKDRPVYGFDNENYVGKHDYSTKNFIEVVNYKSWFKDIFKLINEETVGIDLAFSVDQDDGTGAVNIGQIDGSIDVDASKFVLPIPKVIDANTFGSNDIVVEKSIKRGADGEETLVETILDNLNAGIDLSVNRDTTHYADLNLTYAEQAAYVSLNEDVIKSKMDVETLNFVIDKVTQLVDGDGTEEARRIVRGEEKEEGLFDFITSSELITAIKSGHYEGIIDVLESISNNADGINLKLNLSSLGLGEDAKVELNLGATHNGEQGVTSLKCSDIKMAEGIFNLELNTRPYVAANIDKVLSDKDNYQDLNFAVGVFDQVTGILDSKKTGFKIEGSLLGEDKLGMSFDGQGQLDYGEKYGFGDIVIKNYNNAENVTEVSEIHPVSLYFDNTSENKEANEMKLAYGQHKALKGKLNVKSIEDIVAVGMKIFEANDRRFAKFLDPIMKIVNESVIGQIISTKDYLQLAERSFVKKIAQNLEGTCLDIVLSDKLFAGFVVGDLNIRLNFQVKDGKKQLKSLQILDLKLNETLGNKTVNCTISIEDFDPNRELPLDLNDNYLNFSSLSTLVQFGIDSTELNCYHLTANVALNLSVIEVANLKLDFWIEVVGEDTKVYGVFPNIPYIIIASNDANANVGSEFIFEPSKHYDISSDDSIGGYFHILRTEDHHGLFNRNFEQHYYRATSKAFVDNIATYLLAGVLDFRYDLVSQIGNIDLDTSTGAQEVEYMFKDDGFKYSEKNGVSSWDIGMNLDKVSGIEALKSLDATLSGEKMNVDGKDKYYFNALSGDLVVKASIVTINMHANIKLQDIDPTKKSWAEQCPDINARFEAICGIYNNMSASEKAAYDNDYLNKPKVDYSGKKIDSSFPSFLK